jgi:hypothetical protein
MYVQASACGVVFRPVDMACYPANTSNRFNSGNARRILFSVEIKSVCGTLPPHAV